MKKNVIKELSIFLIYVSGISVLSGELELLEPKIDSVKTINADISPHNFFGLDVTFDKIATISEQNGKKYLNIINADGTLLWQTECNNKAYLCRFISAGESIFVFNVYDEKQYSVDIYEFGSKTKLISFDTDNFVYPSPNGHYFYPLFSPEMGQLPIVYDSIGRKLGEVCRGTVAWEMTSLNDSVLVLMEGNHLKLISVPELIIQKEVVFEALSKPALEIKIAISPDNTVIAAYTPDSIVIYDIIKETWTAIGGSYPEYGSGDNIFVTDSGKYVVSFTFTLPGNALAYNLFARTDNGYRTTAKFERLPVTRKVAAPSSLRSYAKGQTIVAFYPTCRKCDNRFPGALIQLNDSGGSIIGSNGGIILPHSQPDSKLYKRIIFNSDPNPSVLLEFLNAK